MSEDISRSFFLCNYVVSKDACGGFCIMERKKFIPQSRLRR